jgi:DNA-binding ferritin-like protein
MASDKEAVPKAKINVRPPRERQREQKGTLKRVTQRAYRAKKRKDKGQMARDARRRYLRNKTRILLYQQRRADKPKLHKRLTGGGSSTMQQKNSKKAMQRQAIRSVFSRMYRSVPVDHVRHIDFVASQNKPVNEKLWTDVISLAKGERKTPLSVGGVEVAPVRGGEGFRKYPSAYANGWASKTYKDLGGTWKKEASHQDPALATLQVLLAILRGAHWAHWTSHWQVKGMSYYGDHELLQRIYEGLIEEIDTLAEKIVGKYGSQAVAPVDQAQIMANTLLPLAEAEAQSDPILRALIIEEALQKVFKNVYDALKKMDAMSLGMDDFIMSMANTHETFQYLLRQRTR